MTDVALALADEVRRTPHDYESLSVLADVLLEQGKIAPGDSPAETLTEASFWAQGGVLREFVESEAALDRANAAAAEALELGEVEP